MSVVLEALRADLVLDARNVPCPGPLLSIKKALATVEVGQVLELLATDAGAHEDIPAWARKSGNDYAGALRAGSYDRHFVVRRK